MAWGSVLISSEPERDVHVVTLLGKLDDGTARELTDALAAVSTRNAKVVVDLGGCESVDSSALQALARACQVLRTDGGQLVVVAERDHLHGALEVATIEEPFAVYPALETALSDGFVGAHAA